MLTLTLIQEAAKACEPYWPNITIFIVEGLKGLHAEAKEDVDLFLSAWLDEIDERMLLTKADLPKVNLPIPKENPAIKPLQALVCLKETILSWLVEQQIITAKSDSYKDIEQRLLAPLLAYYQKQAKAIIALKVQNKNAKSTTLYAQPATPKGRTHSLIAPASLKQSTSRNRAASAGAQTAYEISLSIPTHF